MFISITFRATSIDKTNKTQQKVKGSKFMFKMSTIHANTCIQTTMPLRNIGVKCVTFVSEMFSHGMVAT